ncbi:pyridoxamine 5'-phosphate oxidase family protein [Pontimicrobium sp. IMCC45349]|uniref:pyridoxamine 5'-phosphate oxidase family protein n=1 Tax=Pontimicrobium sp. IMCC45349 TaxID=3391574 RepID=UPI0039A037E3
MNVKNTEQLRELYDYPSGRAKIKTLFELEKHAINFVAKSPFAVISTVNKDYKLDASPRGGAPGFVKVLDNKTLLIPDAKGNNRLDSISNILETQHIGMLFMIPGVDETLRVNGKASISDEAKYLNLFDTERNPPKACIIVAIEELFLHCAKAFMRSQLWSEVAKMERSQFPTMGQMLNDQLKTNNPLETQEEMVARYQKDL